MDNSKLEELIRQILLEIGEDPEREGLHRTPYRVAETLRFLTSGYQVDMNELINYAIFNQGIDNMVIAKDIELYSICEHHMLPIIGRCHIGYIPNNGQVLGISKLARIVDAFARRLQVQERLTEDIAHAVFDAVHPNGVGVMIEAQHLCMKMRGVEKQNSLIVTSTVLGSFRDSATTRGEFLSLVSRPLP